MKYTLTPILLAATAIAQAAGPPVPAKIEFNRDVRPILSEHCFACHGPDAANRQADLRLDTLEGATAPRDGAGAAGLSLAWHLTRHPATAGQPIVLLDADTTLSLEPIDRDEARQRFWDASLPIERDDLPHDFVEGLLDRPTYVLRRGTSPDDAAELLRELATRCPTSF